MNIPKQGEDYEKNTLMAIGLLLAVNHAAFADEKVDSDDTGSDVSWVNHITTMASIIFNYSMQKNTVNKW